jgi:lysophospholipase L1-like esterase
MRAFPVQTALTVLMLAVLLSAAHLMMPALRGPLPAQFISVVDLPAEGTLLSPLVRHADPAPPVPELGLQRNGPASLLDDDGQALDHFYAALWRTEKKQPGAVTRIVHYGDSPTTADLITGDVRALLQSRYGDAGHGYILIDKPWAWYQHTGAQVSGSGWEMSRSSSFDGNDGLFGLGGVSFLARGAASSRIVYATAGHRHFEVWFLKQPGGGSLAVSADGATLGTVDTAGDRKAPGFAGFVAPAGVHALELRVEQPPVRLFGVIAEKPGPGVVYDTLGLNGASIHVLAQIMNAAHWTEELRQRHPDLVIINYGTNEADFGAFIDHGYEKELREAIRRARAALPEASILIMSPMDRGEHSGEDIVTMRTIPRLVAIQRRVARETGCGFFDTFHAMGGEGTMARWYTGQPRLVSADLIHPIPAAGKLIAVIFARELASGLNRYKLRQISRPAAVVSLQVGRGTTAAAPHP